MATLIDPDHDVPVTEALEAQARREMARRAGLKKIPGTHAEQADCVAVIDVLLDQWNEVAARG